MGSGFVGRTDYGVHLFLARPPTTAIAFLSSSGHAIISQGLGYAGTSGKDGRGKTEKLKDSN